VPSAFIQLFRTLAHPHLANRLEIATRPLIHHQDGNSILDDEEAPGGRGGIHCRVTMNTIASSEAIAVKLQKICMSIPIPAGFARSSGWDNGFRG